MRTTTFIQISGFLIFPAQVMSFKGRVTTFLEPYKHPPRAVIFSGHPAMADACIPPGSPNLPFHFFFRSESPSSAGFRQPSLLLLKDHKVSHGTGLGICLYMPSAGDHYRSRSAKGAPSHGRHLHVVRNLYQIGQSAVGILLSQATWGVYLANYSRNTDSES